MGYITKSEEDIEVTSDHVEKLQKHAIEVLATREEEKERALEEKAEEKYRDNESFKKSILDKTSMETGKELRGPEAEEKKKDIKDCVGLKPAAISVDLSPARGQ